MLVVQKSAVKSLNTSAAVFNLFIIFFNFSCFSLSLSQQVLFEMYFLL